MANPLAGLPAVHRLLAEEQLQQARERYGAATVRAAVREVLAEARRRVAQGEPTPAPPALVAEARALLARREAAGYPEVLNATGVLIHTNLGRAPHLAADVSGYLALEYDLDAGTRGERLAPVVERLTRYFGAEAATVVTNNAAALVLLLAAHAAGREVIVSRGELIEIGGSFRLPEIMAAAGARLVEVGCTNRTHPEDYARAVGGDTAGILVVHRSNFHLQGFVSTPELRDLVELAHARGVPLWVDEGSGCHLDLSRYGLRREPTVQEILAAGADAVLFSGDKLLGGPQAGIIVGRAAIVERLAAHPVARAVRIGGVPLAALATTLHLYAEGRGGEIPFWAMAAIPAEALAGRCHRLVETTGVGVVVDDRSLPGAGSVPGRGIPGPVVAIPGGGDIRRRLLAAEPPIVARLDKDRIVVDLRAVDPGDDALVAGALTAACR